MNRRNFLKVTTLTALAASAVPRTSISPGPGFEHVRIKWMRNSVNNQTGTSAFLFRNGERQLQGSFWNDVEFDWEWEFWYKPTGDFGVRALPPGRNNGKLVPTVEIPNKEDQVVFIHRKKEMDELPDDPKGALIDGLDAAREKANSWLESKCKHEGDCLCLKTWARDIDEGSGWDDLY